MKRFDVRKMNQLTNKERKTHYTGLYLFWKSIVKTYPTIYNKSIMEKYKALMEKLE